MAGITLKHHTQTAAPPADLTPARWNEDHDLTTTEMDTSKVLRPDGAGGVSFEAEGAGSDDQTAAEVPFTPVGAIASTDVQAAIAEFDTEKSGTGHDHSGTYQAADADIPTVSASQAEMEAGSEAALRSMSPLRVAQAIAALGGAGSPGAGYGGTSTSSLAIGTGSKSFTTQAGLAYVTGSRVRAASDADPTDFMEGICTSYSGTTLVIDVDTTGGSGTDADWNLSIAGEAPSAWRGAWSAGTYQEGDAVENGGSAYVANATTTQEPPDTDWDLLAQGGATDALDLTTAETDTSLRLAPDGLGGVEWAVGSGGSFNFSTEIEVTAGGGAASIDFTSIPGTGRHLVIEAMVRGAKSAAYDDLLASVNADGGANYDLQSQGAYQTTNFALEGVAQTAWGTGTILTQPPAASATAGLFTYLRVLIPYYANTNIRKIAYVTIAEVTTEASGGLVVRHVMLHWRSAAAITEFTLSFAGGNVAQHSIASLYLIN